MVENTSSEVFEKLIAALMAGKGGAVRNLADLLRTLDPAALLPLATHGSSAVREALVKSMVGREELALAPIIERLANDSSVEVLIALAEAIGTGHKTELVRTLPDPVISTLIAHHSGKVRYPALAAAGGRPLLAPQLADILKDDDGWGSRQRAAEALIALDLPIAYRAVLAAVVDDADEDVSREAALGIESAIADPARKKQVLVGLGGLGGERLARLLELLDTHGSARFPTLAKWLQARLAGQVDLKLLRSYGRDLTEEARLGNLPRGHYLDRAVESAMEVLDGEGRKALLFYGESGVGKSAAIQELTHRLASREDGQAWRVIQIIPSELMVGTKYLGEWQTKVQKLIEACAAPRRVLLVVTGVEALATVGQSSSSDTSVADLLAPHVESGRLAILGEITPEAWKGSFGQSSALGRLFRRVTIEPADQVFTRELLELVAVEGEFEVEEGLHDRLLELAGYHFSAMKLPGRAVGFLRLVMELTEGSRLEVRDLLTTLSRSSGIPVDVLDDDKALDLVATRDFLAARVMGQDNAVECVLDLVTLVKAGLADPEKPTGVLLFVGPTGVGKTELARALAELLFGNADRLLRFDMSEYATYESFERLIGRRGTSGVLTSAITEKPFSVLLLDEIEKSHQNVFDLCLQIFDAGRLTDGAGRTVDFRHTIIILTSNIGAQVPTEERVGFGHDTGQAPDEASITRELRRFFRPEFLGRIDQVVTFQPLGAETADRIARREVARVLRRGGLARRGVTVDLDPGVFGLLLREGYSPAFGARPLKRTVEKLLLLPVARLLASGDVPRGANLRVFVKGQGKSEAVAVEVIAGAEAGAESEPAEASRVPDLAELHARLDELDSLAEGVEARKASLLEASNAPGFWEDQAGVARHLDEIHRLDRLLADLEWLGEEVEVTSNNRDSNRRAEFLSRHELALRRLELLFEAINDDDLGDALVTITRAKATGRGMDAMPMMVRMYRAFARRMGLECRVLSELNHTAAAAEAGEVLLKVSGPGARVLFAGEEGLHQLQRERGHRGRQVERELLRVEVDSAETRTLDPLLVTFEKRKLREAGGSLIDQPQWSLRMLHKPTMTTVEMRTDLDERDGRAELGAYLACRVAREGRAAVTVAGVTRRYRFGAAPMVRDRRSGHSTGRLDRVLRGELELFFTRSVPAKSE